LRKEENTIKIKKQKKERKNNMKKILLMILLLGFAACGTVKDKVGGFKPNTGECPPKAERTLSDIICKEPK
jgi:hypothetical protein